MLRLDDYLARTSHNWYRSAMNIPYDVHLVAYVQMISIMSPWRSIVYEGDLNTKIKEVSLTISRFQVAQESRDLGP